MDLLEAASGLLGHSPEGMGLEVTVESEASVRTAEGRCGVLLSLRFTLEF